MRFDRVRARYCRDPAHASASVCPIDGPFEVQPSSAGAAAPIETCSLGFEKLVCAEKDRPNLDEAERAACDCRARDRGISLQPLGVPAFELDLKELRSL